MNMSYDDFLHAYRLAKNKYLKATYNLLKNNGWSIHMNKHGYFGNGTRAVTEAPSSHTRPLSDILGTTDCTAPNITATEVCQRMSKQEELNPMGRCFNEFSAPAAVATIQVDTSKMNTERDYLLERLSNVYSKLNRDLRKQFDKPSQPPTFSKLVEAIANKAYVIDQKALDRVMEDYDYTEEQAMQNWGVFHFVKWNDYTGFDRVAFHKADAVLDEEYVKARDIVSVMDATQGLEALRTFQAWTYVAPTVN